MKRFTFFILSISTSTLFANPKGESVVHGSSTFVRDENSLTITQKSEKSIINWEDFSIGKGELTRFIQPRGGSSLNRVITENPSLIYGNLQANGRIYLINKTGILVGESAVIDTRGFLASTLDVKDEEFLSGEGLNFFGDSDALFENEGILKSFEDITIIAKEIDNKGSLTSKEGDVNLIATTEIFLKGKEIVIKPECQGYLSNSGKIKAISVRLKSSGNFNELAINQEGIIEANTLIEEGGEILLKSEKGEVRVTGTLKASKKDAGGTIHVLGEYVSLCGDAVLDVSSDFNAGTILVGGDYKGENENIENSKGIFVGSDVNVFADSKIYGNGGKVIFWGDEKNHFYGTVSAKGGVDRGDGGFVEVSSKKDWIYKGKVSTFAGNGEIGMLLLDPSNIRITTFSPSNPLFVPPTYNPGPGEPNPCNLYDVDLETALDSPSHVTISTTNGSAGNGDVTFTTFTGVKWGSATKLTIKADNDIIMQSNSSIKNNTGSSTVLDFSAKRNISTRKIELGNNTLNFEFGALAGGIFNQVSDFITCGAGSSIRGVANNDTFRLDGSISANIALDGQGGTNDIQYNLNTSNTWNITGADSGNLLSGFTFSNIDSITVTSTNDDTFNLNSGGSLTSISVSSGTNVYNVSNGGDVTGFITGGNGDDTFVMASGANISGSINGGGVVAQTNTLDHSANPGNLTLTLPSISLPGITGLATNINAFVGGTGFDTFTINGTMINISETSGKNRFIINAGANVTGTITGASGTDTFDMNAGSVSTINGVAGANVFNIAGGNITTAANGGTGNNIFNITGGSTAFINGEAGNDTFNMNGGLVGGMNGTAGVNVYNINNGTIVNLNGGITQDTFYLNNPAVITIKIDGNGGINNLVGPNAANTWNITDNNDGNIGGANFENINYLIGKANNDDFIFADGKGISGAINGGAGGTNTLDYSAYTTPVIVNLQTSTTTGVGGFSNIDTFVGGTTILDNIIAPNANNTWNINPNNAGNIGGATFFRSFENLSGGTLNDDFVFSDGRSITGTIDGVAGSNSFDYSAYTTPITVNLQTSTATGTGGFSNIEIFKGANDPDDLIIGPNAVNTWNITSSSAGNIGGVASFSQFQNVQGGNLQDSFVFADNVTMTGLVDGGSGANNDIDFTNWTVTQINVDISSGYSNIQKIKVISTVPGGSAIGNGFTILEGHPTSGTWNITGINQGTYGDAGEITFSDIAGLVGTATNDTFIFTDQMGVTGIIDGGSVSPYVNTLDYFSYTTPVYVDLAGGEATGTNGIIRIQNFILPGVCPILLDDLIRLYVTEISLASDLRDDNETYYYYSWPIRIWRIEENLNELTPIYFYEFFRKEIKDKNLLMR